jgi:histone H3/H4
MALIVARALREIKYYRSTITDTSTLLPKDAFMRLVQEVAQGIKMENGFRSSFDGDYRFERDALFALQTMAEHFLVMIFEMTYSTSFSCSKE